MAKVAKFISLLLLASLPGATSLRAQNPPPRIFFTDLLSGPNTGGQNNQGAFVTLYGKRFGTTQGTSTVAVGGGLVDNCPVWSDTKVACQLGPAAQTGNIVVTVNAQASNGLPFTVRSGNIYFVSPSGSDSNPGTFALPWATPVKAKNTMVAGDTTYIRQGTWSTIENFGAVVNLSGTYSGTAGNPIALVGYPGEVPTIDAAAGGRGIFSYNGNLNYLTFSNLHIVNGVEGPVYFEGAVTSHIRFVGNTLHGAINSCFVVEGALQDHKIYGNDIYNCSVTPATSKGYSVYYGGYGTQDSIDIGWNKLHDNQRGKGVQLYGHTPGNIIRNIKIHDNYIYNNCMEGIIMGGSDGGTEIFENTDTQYIYNNLIAGNGYCDINWGYSAILLASTKGTVGNFKIFNNTFYWNGNSPKVSRSGDIDNQGVNSIEVVNNLFYAPSGAPNTYCGYICYEGRGSPSQVSGSHNLFFNFGSGPAWSASSVNADPKFVNPSLSFSVADFHVQAGSPAIDAGMTIAAVLTDFDGVTRPQGPAYDIGAFEVPAGGGTIVLPKAPPNLRVVTVK